MPTPAPYRLDFQLKPREYDELGAHAAVEEAGRLMPRRKLSMKNLFGSIKHLVRL
jgi:hypothetical protein